MSSGSYTSGGSGWQTEFSFPTTDVPVKTVRLDFGKSAPYGIAIDAVQISGPSGDQWASDARASSDNSASAPSYAPGSVNADAVESLRAESPVSEWSENWLAYSPFDAVVFSATDMSSMSPAVLGAIGDYLSAGGNVVLLGKTDLPATWHPWRKQNLAGGVHYGIGFGRCLAFSSENPAMLDSQSLKTLRDTVRDSAHYWQSLPGDSGAANAVMPVVENLKIPVRGIVIIMLAFIIVIGPVNIIYLNRLKRRTWMLWTIPAISFATTLLVFAYSLLREGITPDTRIAGLTVIDQASHRAATIGGTAFYCPLTPSGGLHFDFGTEATPLVQIGNGSGTSHEVDWTQSQHFSARLGFRARAGAFSPAKIRDAPRTHPNRQRARNIAGRQRTWRADQIALGRRRGHEFLRGRQCRRRTDSRVDFIKTTAAVGEIRRERIAARHRVSRHTRIPWMTARENIFCRTPTSPCWTEIRSSKTRSARLPARSAPKASAVVFGILDPADIQ